jgi:hypothetical protein
MSCYAKVSDKYTIDKYRQNFSLPCDAVKEQNKI